MTLSTVPVLGLYLKLVPTPTPMPSGDVSGATEKLKKYCERDFTMMVVDPKCAQFRPKGGNGVWNAITDPIGSVADSAIDKVAVAFAQGAIQMIKWMSSRWVQLDTPQLSQDPDSPVAFLIGATHWLVGFTVVLGLLFAAGRIAWERRGEPIRQAMSGLVTLVMVSGCSVLVVNLALKAGDSYSKTVLNAGADDPVGQSAARLFGLAGVNAVFNPSGPAVTILLALLVILSSLVQFAMMMLRSVMVVVLAGMLPVAAAATVTTEGKSWLRKMLGWLLAFVLYKPVAATLYGVAFMWLRTGKDLEVLQGLVLIILSVLALPALMRFIVPMMSSIGGGSGGGAAAMAGAAALGAKAVSSGGGGSSGSGGDQEPSGGKRTPSGGKGHSPEGGQQQTAPPVEQGGKEPPKQPTDPGSSPGSGGPVGQPSGGGQQVPRGQSVPVGGHAAIAQAAAQGLASLNNNVGKAADGTTDREGDGPDGSSRRG